MMMTHRRFMPVLLALMMAVACSREPLKVATIQVGKSLNSDKSVGTHSTQFKPTDTIYVAVLNNAAGAGTLTARWTYAGRPISEESKNVSYKGEAATEFHIQSSGGFPEGDYKVEVLLDGQSAGTRDFRVVK